MRCLHWGAAALAIGCLAATGCGGNFSKRVDAVSTSTIDDPTTTTAPPRAVAPYSFERSAPPPDIQDEGTDFASIGRSLLAYSAWLESHDPNLSLVSVIAAPSSTFEHAIRSDIEQLRRYNTRFYELQTAPLEIEVVDKSRATVVSLKVVEHITSQRLVEKSGRIVSERKFAVPTTTYSVLLARLADGRWMLADVEEKASQ